MAITKKTVGSSNSPKVTAKTGGEKVAATRIITGKLHTTTGVDASGGFQ